MFEYQLSHAIVVEVTLSVLSTVNVWYCHYLSQVVEVTLSVLSTANVC